MKILTFAAPALAMLFAGCPGTKKTGGGPDGPAGGGKEPGAQDFNLEYEATALPGTYFQPEGIELRPLMLMARGSKKLTLVKQRQAYQKAKPATKVGEAEVLATMLYEEAQKLEDDSARLTMIEEARKALADTRAAHPDKLDVVLLHNLGCLTWDLGDPLAAAEAFGAAATLKPTDAGYAERRAYQIYYLVRGGKNAEAMAAAQGTEPSATEPELAYAIAWAAWRTGDGARALGAIEIATAGWRSEATRPALRRDIAIFSARVSGKSADAISLANKFAGSDKEKLFDTLGLMHQAFTLAGRYAEAIELTDAMLATGVLPSQATKYALLFEKADAAKALGQSEALVGYVKDGLAAWAACGKECEGGGTETAIKLVFNYARFANYLYTTSQDEKWYVASNELYNSYLGLSAITDRDVVQQEAEVLQRGHERALKGVGTHDKDAISFVLVPYRAQVLTCLDNELQQDPSISGALALQLEVAQSGEVTGATSEPAGGEAGLAAAATCATAAARAWTFPARTRPGVTRIGIPYTYAKSE